MRIRVDFVFTNQIGDWKFSSFFFSHPEWSSAVTLEKGFTVTKTLDGQFLLTLHVSFPPIMKSRPGTGWKNLLLKILSFCTYIPICWLPVCQGFFQLLESHGPAFPGVGEEQWSRFPRNLETGTQLKQIRIDHSIIFSQERLILKP